MPHKRFIFYVLSATAVITTTVAAFVAVEKYAYYQNQNPGTAIAAEKSVATVITHKLFPPFAPSITVYGNSAIL